MAHFDDAQEMLDVVSAPIPERSVRDKGDGTGFAPNILADVLPSIKVQTGVASVLADVLPSIKVQTGVASIFADVLPSIKVQTGVASIFADVLPSIKVQTGVASVLADVLPSIKIKRGLAAALGQDPLTIQLIKGIQWDAELRSLLDTPDFSDLVQSLRGSSDGDLLAAEIDDIFSEIPGSESALTEAPELFLVTPFGYDRSVRMAFQIVVMLVVAAIIFGVGVFAGTIVAAALAAVGTPKATETWKATGKAYDWLYRKDNYHPGKALEAKQPPSAGPRDLNDKW
ncbi:hypothetical protein V1638_05235 [Pseudarthrobacter sp. J64]|uniref:hypothetical protein n=1 Tax=Pseudarthrobacter sp. J64 TaxID=3116485 RepID=UPI002E823015|nr:hypothetical protein [Pseudarthrobacter sp. J64]MEE2568798.1 hypothetical protein [Pseudarthrobacter sp. J64]